MDAVLEKLSNAAEGLTLGLSAFGEVFQKMNDRLEKADVEDDEDKEAREAEEAEKEAEMMKAELIKSVVSEVLKQIEDRGGSKEKNVAGKEYKWPMEKRTDPTEKEKSLKADATVKPGTEQNVIQAADVEEDKKEEEAEVPEKEKEYPKVEETLKSEIAGLRKQIADIQKSADQKIEDAVKTRLNKMGFREEKSLRPKVMKSPVEKEDVPIVKFEDKRSPEEVVEALTKLSFRQLNDIDIQKRAGNLSGVPNELMQ